MNLFLITVLAASLPTFEDFQRVDRARRSTGQQQTAALLEVSQIKPDLILRTVEHCTNEVQLIWGAAELMAEWPKKRTLFESALEVSSTNVAVALRYACAAARRGETDLALKWLRYCQRKEADNTVSWLAELWVARTQGTSPLLIQNSPVDAAVFRDYSVEASRARIRMLEKAGYSPYAARRLGFKPDSDALQMLRDLCKPPIAEGARPLLRDSAVSLQQHPQYLLTELVGQTVERAVFAGQPGADLSDKVDARMGQILSRRDELTKLLADVERDTIDFVTEQQMVDYYDNILVLGEEAAMKKLIVTVRPTK